MFIYKEVIQNVAGYKWLVIYTILMTPAECSIQQLWNRNFHKLISKYCPCIFKKKCKFKTNDKNILRPFYVWRSSSNVKTYFPKSWFLEFCFVMLYFLARPFYIHSSRFTVHSRERLHFRTPGSVLILGLANASIFETKFLELAMPLLDFSSRIPLDTFSILLIA